MKFDALRGEYARLWASAVITPAFDAAAAVMAEKILASKIRYQVIEAQTGVPWYVVGVLHAMESGCRFSTHLHNGDPLTAKTKRIPKNRPAKGKAPFTWEESACDALMLKNLHQVTDWSTERICYEFERYNGWGYRQYHPEVLSAYLWSGTQHYVRGKYVKDGKWDGSFVSQQAGAIPLLKRVDELDDSIDLSPVVVPEPAVITEAEIVPDTYPKADEKAPPSPATVATVGTTAGVAAAQVIPAPPAEIAENVTQLSAWQSLVTAARSLTLYGVEFWPWVLGFVVTIAGLTWWSRRAS